MEEKVDFHEEGIYAYVKDLWGKSGLYVFSLNLLTVKNQLL